MSMKLIPIETGQDPEYPFSPIFDALELNDSEEIPLALIWQGNVKLDIETILVNHFSKQQ